jgi:hypothetical protein
MAVSSISTTHHLLKRAILRRKRGWVPLRFFDNSFHPSRAWLDCQVDGSSSRPVLGYQHGPDRRRIEPRCSDVSLGDPELGNRRRVVFQFHELRHAICVWRLEWSEPQVKKARLLLPLSRIQRAQ